MFAAAILFGASFTVAVAAALGTLLLGREPRDLPLRFVAGAAFLSLVVFCLCSLHWAYVPVFLGVGIAALAAAGRPAWSRPKWPASRLLMAAFGVYLVVYFFNAMAPEISFDGSRYHLGLVLRELGAHGLTRITDNFYAAFPAGVEMLYLFAFAFGRHSAASLVHFTFLLALVWLMWDYARRAGFAAAGAAACLLVFASPLMGVDATSAYNDVAVAAIAFAVFAVAGRWEEKPSPRLALAAGLVAGFGFAAKYTAWPGLAYACAFPLMRRQYRQAALAAGAGGLMAVPWLAKNWLFLQNPVAPFFNHWFLNPYITAAFEEEYRHHMAWYSLTSRWQIPMQVTTYGSLSGLLGPVFLLSPIALAALGHREGRRLLLAGAVFGCTYFSNISARFLLPAMPFVALAMAFALRRTPRLAVGLAVGHAVLSWPTLIPRYSHADAWHLFKPLPYREALRIKPEDGYLQSNLPLYGAARLVERLAPPDAAVFTNTPIPEAYTTRRILVGYQAQANIVSRAILWSGVSPGYAPVWTWRFPFARQPLRGIRLVQTATGAAAWQVNEVRLFDEGRELPLAGWRLDAKPYPWHTEDAFDGRPISFWMCGDPLHPGEWLSARFPAPLEADAVEVLTAHDQPSLRMRLEGLDPAGRWELLSDAPRASDAAAPPDLRRQAANELKRRGIDCLLMFDGEPGADDLRQKAAQWGVQPLGDFQGARLYRLP